MDKTAERLYAEREKRVTDAIELRKPDRVPIVVSFSFFPATYIGATFADLMYDPEKTTEAFLKANRDFQPDMVHNPYVRFLGPLLDALDCKEAKWPGRNLPPHLPFQYIDDEYMKAEEYDALLSDPSDFIVRRLWPRIFGALKGLEKLPPLHDLISYTVGMPSAFRSPEVAAALQALHRMSEESIKIDSYSRAYAQKTKEDGFPMDSEASSMAPFDVLGDFLRGTKGVMLDMYRRPELLVKACEKLLPFLIEKAVAGARASGNPRIFIALHKGTDTFLSREQFLKFYWPTLSDLMLALIQEGLCPCPFIEGEYMSRLDIIKDIPAGKACYKFEMVDLVEIRKTLGERICLRGGVPISLLVTGTPQDVREYCKRLIDRMAKRGPFILDTSSGLDHARPDNVKALFDAARDHGDL